MLFIEDSLVSQILNRLTLAAPPITGFLCIIWVVLELAV